MRVSMLCCAIDVNQNVSVMFADDIVLCGYEETDMTEYLETRRRALEDRG